MQGTAIAMAGFALGAPKATAAERKDWLMKPLEADPDSGAEIFLLTGDERPADNIYGEQPYSPPEGNRIAVRYYSVGKRVGGLSILDLGDGSLHPVVTQDPRFPAFHAWGQHLCYQEMVGGRLMLRRCHYQTLAKEDIVEVPQKEGRLSYGTVSPDMQYYAVSVHPEGGGSKVLVMNLKTGEQRIAAHEADLHFKHEQFSMDGRNRVLIQANKMPDVKMVLLGAIEAEREGIRWFPADRPHTPRPTGHEAWVGRSDRILFSTGSDKNSPGNVWTAGLDDAAPALVSRTPTRFGHISVSRCGRFWIGDATGEPDVPIHIGSLKSGTHWRLVFSRTKHDGKQWSHTHPYLTADNRWLIYNSTRSGRAQVYGARIKPGWLDSAAPPPVPFG
jgi:Tol biopolymer transport system component